MNAASDIVNWSMRVRRLVALVVVLCFACWLLVGFSVATDGAPPFDNERVVLLVVGLWVPWLLLHWSHFRLVRAGRVAERYRWAPQFVNRPDLMARLVMHLIVNWLVLATSLGLAWLVTDRDGVRVLAGLTAAASVLIWCSFNWQHRRENRVKNLAVSTTIAVIISAAAAYLFVR